MEIYDEDSFSNPYVSMETCFVDEEDNTIFPIMITFKGLNYLAEKGITIVNDHLEGDLPEYLKNVKIGYTPSGAPYVSKNLRKFVKIFNNL